MTFLNHIKSDTLDEIKTWLENRGNEWSSYLSFHSCSFWNGSVWLELAESAAGRVVLLQLLYIHDGAVGVTNLDVMLLWLSQTSLQWHHNEREGVSDHRRPDCVLNRLFRHRPRKTPKLRVTGLCEGNSPVTGEFPAQRASKAGNVSIGWLHRGGTSLCN